MNNSKKQPARQLPNKNRNRISSKDKTTPSVSAASRFRIPAAVPEQAKESSSTLADSFLASGSLTAEQIKAHQKTKKIQQFRKEQASLLSTGYSLLSVMHQDSCTHDELISYVAGLIHHMNPYQKEHFLFVQREFLKQRRNSILGTLSSLMYDSGKGNQHVAFQNYLFAIRNGLSCLCVATDDMEASFPHMFPLEYGFFDKIEASADSYITITGSREPLRNIPSSLFYPVYGGFQLTGCNAYSTDRGYLFFEDISADIGAFIRCGYAHMLLKPETPYSYVMLVSSLEDARFFAKLQGCGNSGERFLKGRLFFSFLLYEDMGKPNKLFTLDASGQPVYLPAF